jgi:hypothetical protein
MVPVVDWGIVVQREGGHATASRGSPSSSTTSSSLLHLSSSLSLMRARPLADLTVFILLLHLHPGAVREAAEETLEVATDVGSAQPEQVAQQQGRGRARRLVRHVLTVFSSSLVGLESPVAPAPLSATTTPPE